jgi:hypothetical protein
MPTPPNASAAKTTSDTDKVALTAAANQAFIDNSVVAINQATANGKYEVFQMTSEHCDFNQLALYFQNLGYQVFFPDFPPFDGSQPAELFGPFYIAYWENQLIPTNMRPRNPVRLGLRWKLA